MDYGLWLLIGLLVVIALVFLLSGRSKAERTTDAPPAPVSVASLPLEAAPVAAAPQPTAVVAAPEAAPPASIVIPVEPIMEAKPQPAFEPVPVSPAVTAAPAQADDLLRLKGVGPKLQALLIELGVTRYAEIAAWSDSDIAAVDARLGNFKGRPVRDHWVDQAKYLAAGDIAGFEAKYGKV